MKRNESLKMKDLQSCLVLSHLKKIFGLHIIIRGYQARFASKKEKRHHMTYSTSLCLGSTSRTSGWSPTCKHFSWHKSKETSGCGFRPERGDSILGVQLLRSSPSSPQTAPCLVPPFPIPPWSSPKLPWQPTYLLWPRFCGLLLLKQGLLTVVPTLASHIREPLARPHHEICQHKAWIRVAISPLCMAHSSVGPLELEARGEQTALKFACDFYPS